MRITELVLGREVECFRIPFHQLLERRVEIELINRHFSKAFMTSLLQTHPYHAAQYFDAVVKAIINNFYQWDLKTHSPTGNSTVFGHSIKSFIVGTESQFW
jgi:hypothetical protein